MALGRQHRAQERPKTAPEAADHAPALEISTFIGFPNWFDYLDAFDIAARPTASHSDYENLFSVIIQRTLAKRGSVMSRKPSPNNPNPKTAITIQMPGYIAN